MKNITENEFMNAAWLLGLHPNKFKFSLHWDQKVKSEIRRWGGLERIEFKCRLEMQCGMLTGAKTTLFNPYNL